MISKRNIKRISLTLLVILFCVIFFLLNLHFIFSDFFTSNLSDVTTSKISKHYTNEALVNKKLKESLINENEELRKILKLEKESKFNLIHAQITVKSPIVLSGMGYVNKGKNDGVKEGYLVINDKGLIGKIGKVFENHSEIIFPHSPRFSTLVLVGEDHKGLEFLKEAHDLISQSFLKDYFIGFVEPNKITSDICDIIISDGYTGNIILKTAEGLSSFITNNLKNVFNKSLKNKLSYKIIENDLKIFRDKINPDKYNGASLIGVNGISIKSHGNASPYAFSYALDKCYNLIKNNFNMKIRNNLARL